MLIRQTAPVIGADGSTYTPKGEWNFNLSARNLRSTDHYNTDIEQVQRQTLGTYVVNLQKSIDLTIGYQASPRLSVAASVPFISASWSIPSPTGPTPGPRAQEDALGIGDISVAARSWVLNPKSHPMGNFAVGLGLKIPTGKSNVQDTFPGINGTEQHASRRRHVGAAGRRRLGHHDRDQRLQAHQPRHVVRLGQLPDQPAQHQQHAVDSREPRRRQSDGAQQREPRS